MSNDASLGVARLVSVLESKKFEADAKRLETEMLARFKRIAAAGDSIFTAKSFGGATAGVRTLDAVLKPLTADLKAIGVAGQGLGDGVATGATAATRQLKPMQDSIRGLSNSLSDYKLQLVSSDGAQDQLASGISNVIKNARQLREQVAQNSTEYGRLTGIIKSGTTTLTSAEKGMRGLGTGAINLSNALPGLIGAAGIGGLVTAAGSFVNEAQRAQSATVLFDRAVERSGVSANDANALVERLAGTYGILPSTVQSATSVLLKNGASLEDVDRILQSAGASAAAAGFDISTAFENVAQGAAQGRSELFESSGIITNVSDAYKTAADALGVSTDALSQEQKIRAISNALYEESRYEIEDLDAVLTDNVKSQQNYRTELAEFRQEMGERFAPAMATGANAAASLLKGFDGLPEVTQSSIAGVGGVTLGVSALATGLTALRPLLAATFLPPGGAIVLGVAAAAALGTALYNLSERQKTLADTSRIYAEASREGIEALQQVKTVDDLVTALGTVETTLTGPAKEAWTTYAEEIRKTKGEITDVPAITAEAITKLLQVGIVAQETAVNTARDELFKAIGQTTGLADAQLSEIKRAISGGSSEISAALTKVRNEVEATIAEQAGLGIPVTQYENQLAALSTLEYGVRNFQDAQRELAETEEERRKILEAVTGTTADLSKVSEEARAAFSDTSAQFKQLNSLDGGGANQLLGSLQSLKDTYPALREALNPLIVSTRDYISELGKVGSAGEGFDGAVDPINRATTATRALGTVSTEVQLAQKQAQDSMLAALGAPIPLPDAKPILDLFGGLRTAIHDSQVQLAFATDAGAAWGEMWLRTGGDAQTGLDRAGAALSGIVGKATTTFQGIGNAASTAFTNTAKPLGDLSAKLQEIDRNAKLFGDTEDLAAQRAAAYRTAIEQLAAVHGENSGIVQQLKTLYDEYTASVQANEDATTAQAAAVERQTQFLDDLKAGLADVGTNFRDTLNPIGDLNAGLAEIDRNAALTGDSSSVLADKTRLYESALTALAARLGQTHPLVLLLKKRFDESKDATDADTKAKEQAAERTRVLEGAISSLSGVLKGMVGNLVDADSEMGIFANTAVDALSSLLTLDFVGFFSAIAQGISDMFTAAAEESKRIEEAVGKYDPKELEARGILTFSVKGLELDEGALAEYEQYLEAIETYGQGIADKFYTVGENGKYAFDEEAAATFADGLERVQDRADGVAQAMKDAKDATDSVLEAELSANEDTLQAKLDSQGGAYSEADIFAQQSQEIARAAQDRDSAYQEAADLEAAGQADLAVRRRAAAEQAYAAEISQINQSATDRAIAIGKNSADFQSRLDQAAVSEGQRWTQYWNQDAAAQIEAQKQAQIQLRRFQHVLNSDRYAEILAATGNEQLAWEQASAELGYTIDATNGNLLTQQDAAAQQQSQSLTNSGNLLAGAATNLFGGASTQISTDGATLRGQIAGEGSLLSSTITSALGLADSAFGIQGSALSSTIASVYDSLIGTATDGSNLFGTALTNGANLNLGAITVANNAIGRTVVSGGKALSQAEADKANQLIRQKQEASSKEAQAEGKFGSEVSKIVARVATAKGKQVIAAGKAQAQTIASVANQIIGTIRQGNEGQANAFKGVYKTINVNLFKDAFANLGQNAEWMKIVGNFNPDYAEVIDPAKYAEQQAKKVGSPSKASGGSVGSGKGSGSKGSGSKGGKGSGGKKDGSTYTGGKPEDYPYKSPGWYEAQMRLVDEQIKRTSDPGRIADLKADKAKLQAAYDALLGVGDKADAPGSINDLQNQLRKQQELYDGYGKNVADSVKAATAERIKQLKAEIAEKQKLLQDAAKDAQDAVKGTVISIESPLTDLGSLSYLMESVSKSVSSLPASVSAASTGAAASVTRIPETYTSTVLPSYQAQMDVATTMFDKSVSRFDNATIRFDRSSIRIEQALKRMLGAGGVSPLVSEARGDSITSYQFK